MEAEIERVEGLEGYALVEEFCQREVRAEAERNMVPERKVTLIDSDGYLPLP